MPRYLFILPLLSLLALNHAQPIDLVFLQRREPTRSQNGNPPMPQIRGVHSHPTANRITLPSLSEALNPSVPPLNLGPNPNTLPPIQNHFGQPQHSGDTNVQHPPRPNSRGSPRDQPGVYLVGAGNSQSVQSGRSDGTVSQGRSPSPSELDPRFPAFPKVIPRRTTYGDYWIALWEVYTGCIDIASELLNGNETRDDLIEKLRTRVAAREHGLKALQRLKAHYNKRVPLDIRQHYPGMKAVFQKITSAENGQRVRIIPRMQHQLNQYSSGEAGLTVGRLRGKVCGRGNQVVKSLDLAGVDQNIVDQLVIP